MFSPAREIEEKPKTQAPLLVVLQIIMLGIFFSLFFRVFFGERGLGGGSEVVWRLLRGGLDYSLRSFLLFTDLFTFTLSSVASLV